MVRFTCAEREVSRREAATSWGRVLAQRGALLILIAQTEKLFPQAGAFVRVANDHPCDECCRHRHPVQSCCRFDSRNGVRRFVPGTDTEMPPYIPTVGGNVALSAGVRVFIPPAVPQ